MKKNLITLILAAAMAIVSCTKAPEIFTTNGSKLIDASGQEFVIKGMNNPHAWFGETAYNALDEIRAIGANTIRIVWQTRGKDEELERIIQKCIELKMVPMVELHDVTGSPDKERLVAMAKWYSEPSRVEMINKYEKYIMLNIANEWGNHTVSSEYWLESYSEAVSVMREAGYRMTLVVDGPGWGQNITPFIEKGNELIAADPEHNILLSIHMYGSWNDADKIRTDLGKCKELNLPVIVGEFGYNYDDGNNNLGCKADHTVILETCNRLGYGFMPWSWTGNNAENQWLDLVDNKDWKTLTWWGEQVISGPGGITETAKTSNIFN